MATTPHPPRRRLFDYIIHSTNSVGELLLLYGLMVIGAGVAYAFLEGKPFWDSMWWAVVTTTTTGYGDMFPVTPLGRILASAVMLISILFVLPLLIGRIAMQMIEDHDEFTHHEQEALKAEISALRADIAKLLAKHELA